MDDRTKKHLNPRLKRIEGQVRGIQKMVAEGRYCIEVVDQIHAVKGALDQAALMVLKRHMNSCVAHAIQEKQGPPKIDEMITSIDRFLR